MMLLLLRVFLNGGLQLVDCAGDSLNVVQDVPGDGEPNVLKPVSVD
jgi:hypothetical protein